MDTKIIHVACPECRTEDTGYPGLWMCKHCGHKWTASSGGADQPTAPTGGALATQVGGDHYKQLAIQPAEFVHRNRIPYLEGSIIYYVTRWREKNGIEDLKKARHTLDMMIELETTKGASHG